MIEPVAAGRPRAPDGLPQWLRVAIGGGGGMFVGMGLGRFSYSAMMSELIASGELTELQAGWVGGLNFAGFAVGAFFSVRLRAQWGTTRVLTFAVVVSVLVLAASAAPLGFAWLAVWRGLVGIATGIMMVLSLALITATAPAARRNVAAGCVFAGVGCAIILTGLLVPRLLTYGLVVAWLGLAALGLAAMGIALWGWRAAPGEPRSAPGVLTSPWTQPLYLLLASHFCFSVAIVPHTLYWVDYLVRDLGLGMTAGGRYWSLAGFASAVGPWVTAGVGYLLGTTLALPLTFIVLGLGIGVPLWSSAGSVLLLSSVLFGAQPGLSALMAARARDLANAEHMPRVMRAMVLANAAGALVAGVALPLLYQLTHSYVLMFAIGGASMIIGGLLVVPWIRPSSA